MDAATTVTGLYRAFQFTNLLGMVALALLLALTLAQPDRSRTLRAFVSAAAVGLLTVALVFFVADWANR